MLSELLWKSEWKKFLRQAQSSWGGISGDSFDKWFDEQKRIRPVLSYISWKQKVNGEDLFISLSEMPNGIAGVLDAVDSVDFLSIMFEVPTEYNVAIRKEGFFDRIQKKIGLLYEYETGNIKFDKKYFLYLKDEKDKSLLSNRSFQDSVESIEPFTYLSIQKDFLVWCHDVTKSEQLSYNTVFRKVEELRYFSSKLPS